MAHLTTARRKLASALTRALHSYTLPNSRPIPSYPRSLFSLSSLLNDRAVRYGYGPLRSPARFKSSGSRPLNEQPSNWTNRPPKETILLDGCDFEHWLVIMEFPKEPKPTEDDMVNSYVKTLAAVLGSEEEAKKKIYSVNTRTYTGFGCLIPEDLSHKIKELPGVLWVLPDSYLDVPNKDYGGDLFEDGKVTHRPQYWYENSTQNTPRRRPRHDRPRERMQMDRGRGESMQPHSRGGSS